MRVGGSELGIADADDLSAFLIRHMTMEQRRILRTERPLLYKRVFPSANDALIMSDVLTAMAALPGSTTGVS